jgi:hypothetical protein
VTITQIEIRFKTNVSHKHMVVIYHRNTPLPKVRKGLDRYNEAAGGGDDAADPGVPGDRFYH